MNDNSMAVDRLIKWHNSDNLASAGEGAHARNHAIASSLAALAGYVYAKDKEYLKKVANDILNGDDAPYPAHIWPAGDHGGTEGDHDEPATP